MYTETLTIGLQQGDTCRIITDAKQRIYLKALRTRGGYVKLEVEIPERFWADVIRRRDEDGRSD